MKRSTALLTALLLVSLGWNAALFLRPAQAAPVHTRALPVVVGGAAFQATPTPVVATQQLYTCQCGSATAWVDTDGTVMVTFLSHDQGGKNIVAIDNGVTFVEQPDPLAFFPGEPLPGPAFDAPGLKDAPGMAVKAFGRRVLYMPVRTVDGGNYNLWRIVW